MKHQRDLFDAESTRDMHRRTDPDTSRQAAAEVVKTGIASSQRERLLATLLEYPNMTTAELAKLAHMDRHAAGRRMPELVNHKPSLATVTGTRKCGINGTMAQTYKAVES